MKTTNSTEQCGTRIWRVVIYIIQFWVTHNLVKLSSHQKPSNELHKHQNERLLDSPCKAGALALFHFGVQLLVITVNIKFQSQPTSQNVMFWLKWTLACSFSFFQLFPKKVQKSCPKVGTRWDSHQWLIKFKALSFLGPSKIKCQTTGRPRTCPPCHIPFAKSDYNPRRRRRRTLQIRCTPKWIAQAQKQIWNQLTIFLQRRENF